MDLDSIDIGPKLKIWGKNNTHDLQIKDLTRFYLSHNNNPINESDAKLASPKAPLAATRLLAYSISFPKGKINFFYHAHGKLKIYMKKNITTKTFPPYLSPALHSVNLLTHI